MADDTEESPRAPHPDPDATLASLSGVEIDDSVALRETPGTRIGPYRLVQLIGEGGFGSVFMAEQERPVVRTVALKIIKLGMDTRQVVARFEQERQALALMDHPGIARVFDAGATEAGRPYFVMELVRGEPITTYCDRQRLPIVERLALFVQVCAAVQHAHVKGIIHRDLKPSNVLVSTQDGAAQPKVIDFGIAKATAAKLTEKTLVTERRSLIGTPEYMSPEQSEGSLDIDTRSDVYSLGVLLYELVTGTTPFSGRDLRSVGYAEIQRIIREVDPPRPSTRIGQSTETIIGVAERRQVPPNRLGTIVRGELDWIVMRALEKDRRRRYESASALAADVVRHLAGEAVVAAPPSATYRFGKFVRRHRGAAVAVASVAIALLAGVAAFAWQAKVANDQRDRAIAAERETEQRADELERVAAFQSRMLEQIDPAAAGARLTEEVTARLAAAMASDRISDDDQAARSRAFAGEWRLVNATDVARQLIDRTILQPAVAAIDRDFAGQPLVGARLRKSIADLYRTLGLYEEALPLLRSALEIRVRLLGADDFLSLQALSNYADLLRAQGKFEEAAPLVREALDRCRRALGNDHRLTMTAMNNMGYLLNAQGRAEEGLPYLNEALDTQRRVLGEDDRETLTSLENMGLLLQGQGKLAEAEDCLRRTLDGRRRTLAADDPDTVRALVNTSFVLINQSRFAEAEPLVREGLERDRRTLGDDHPDTIAALNNLAFAIQNQGRLAEAEPFLREAVMRYRRVLGDDHPDTMAGINNLGILLQDLNRIDEAEKLLREALDLRRRALGEDHPRTLDSIGNVGRLLQSTNRLDEAEPFLREALDRKRRLRGEEHPDTLTSINNLGALFQSQGKYADAERMFREAMEKCRRVLGEGHANTLITTINTGAALRAGGPRAEAVELLTGVEAKARAAFTGAYGRWVAKLLTDLGRAKAALGEFAEAETRLLEAQPMQVATRGPAHADTRTCTQALVDLYEAWEAADPGKGHAARATPWRTALEAMGAPASR